jgi:hypothetical protein
MRSFLADSGGAVSLRLGDCEVGATAKVRATIPLAHCRDGGKNHKIHQKEIGGDISRVVVLEESNVFFVLDYIRKFDSLSSSPKRFMSACRRGIAAKCELDPHPLARTKGAAAAALRWYWCLHCATTAEIAFRFIFLYTLRYVIG